MLSYRDIFAKPRRGNTKQEKQNKTQTKKLSEFCHRALLKEGSTVCTLKGHDPYAESAAGKGELRVAKYGLNVLRT